MEACTCRYFIILKVIVAKTIKERNMDRTVYLDKFSIADCTVADFSNSCGHTPVKIFIEYLIKFSSILVKNVA